MDASNFRSHWNDLNLFLTEKLQAFFDKVDLYFPKVDIIMYASSFPLESNLKPLAKKYNMHTKYTHTSSDTLEGHILRYIFMKLNFEIQPSILTSWLWLIELFTRVIKNKNIELDKLSNRIDFIDPNDHILCRIQCNKFSWNQLMNRLNKYLSIFLDEIKLTCDVIQLEKINKFDDVGNVTFCKYLPKIHACIDKCLELVNIYETLNKKLSAKKKLTRGKFSDEVYAESRKYITSFLSKVTKQDPSSMMTFCASWIFDLVDLIGDEPSRGSIYASNLADLSKEVSSSEKSLMRRASVIRRPTITVLVSRRSSTFIVNKPTDDADENNNLPPIIKYSGAGKSDFDIVDRLELKLEKEQATPLDNFLSKHNSGDEIPISAITGLNFLVSPTSSPQNSPTAKQFDWFNLLGASSNKNQIYASDSSDDDTTTSVTRKDVVSPTVKTFDLANSYKDSKDDILISSNMFDMFPSAVKPVVVNEQKKILKSDSKKEVAHTNAVLSSVKTTKSTPSTISANVLNPKIRSKLDIAEEIKLPRNPRGYKRTFNRPTSNFAPVEIQENKNVKKPLSPKLDKIDSDISNILTASVTIKSDSPVPGSPIIGNLTEFDSDIIKSDSKVLGTENQESVTPQFMSIEDTIKQLCNLPDIELIPTSNSSGIDPVEDNSSSKLKDFTYGRMSAAVSSKFSEAVSKANQLIKNNDLDSAEPLSPNDRRGSQYNRQSTNLRAPSFVKEFNPLATSKRFSTMQSSKNLKRSDSTVSSTIPMINGVDDEDLENVSAVNLLFSLDMPFKEPLFPAKIDVHHNIVQYQNLVMTFRFLNNPIVNYLHKSGIGNFLCLIFICGLLAISFIGKAQSPLVFSVYFFAVHYCIVWVFLTMESTYLLYNSAKTFEFWYLLFWNIILTSFSMYNVVVAPFATFERILFGCIEPYAIFWWLLCISLIDTLVHLNARYKIFTIMLCIAYLLSMVFTTGRFGDKINVCMNLGYEGCVRTDLIIVSAIFNICFYWLRFVLDNLEDIARSTNKYKFMLIKSDIQIDEIMNAASLTSIKRFLDARFNTAKNYYIPTSDNPERLLTLSSNFLQELSENGLYIPFTPALGFFLYDAHKKHSSFKIIIAINFIVAIALYISGLNTLAKLITYTICFSYAAIIAPSLCDRTLVYRIFDSFEFLYLIFNTLIGFLIALFLHINSSYSGAEYYGNSQNEFIIVTIMTNFAWLYMSIFVLLGDSLRKSRRLKIALLGFWSLMNLYLAYYEAVVIPTQFVNGVRWLESIQVCLPSGPCLDLIQTRVGVFITISLFTLKFCVFTIIYPNATMILKASWVYDAPAKDKDTDFLHVILKFLCCIRDKPKHIELPSINRGSFISSDRNLSVTSPSRNLSFSVPTHNFPSNTHNRTKSSNSTGIDNNAFAKESKNVRQNFSTPIGKSCEGIDNDGLSPLPSYSEDVIGIIELPEIKINISDK